MPGLMNSFGIRDSGFAIAASRRCSGGALHGITAGAGKAETRGQAALPPCATKRRRFVPEIPAAQWNELRALFVDKSQEIRFLRKHATHSIAPQERKRSFICHFAALVFCGLSAGFGFTFTRGYPM